MVSYMSNVTVRCSTSFLPIHTTCGRYSNHRLLYTGLMTRVHNCLTRHRTPQYKLLCTIDLKLYSSQHETPKITSEEYNKFRNGLLLRKLNYRTCVTSNLADFINKKITLLGWIEPCPDRGNVLIVDGYGKVLCSILPENRDLQGIFQSLQPQDLVSADGCVIMNPTTNQPHILLDNISSMNNHDGITTDSPAKNSYTYRTHTCGELRHTNIGEKVRLCGWVQYQRMSKFLLLRDSHGLIQCILPDNMDMSNIQQESVVRVDGTVVARPLDMINHTMATGDIEVITDNFEVLNLVDNIPFTLRNHQKPKEQLRLQHRYVDLRYPEMQNNLRLRSQILHNMRRFLIERHSFVEVETPTLFCRTPGGAREFVVPTHHRGLFYSLVQSPQQFKQMLMVGGVDRYFQVARCYRDESTRPDRQPEFTQLDIELSFATVDDILKLIEDLLYMTYPVPISKTPFKRLTYREALETYGTDKPDMRYKLKFNNVTYCIENIHSVDDFGSYAMLLPAEMEKLPNKTKENIRSIKKRYDEVSTLDYHKLPKGVQEKLASQLKLEASTIPYIAAGPNDDTCLYLGEVRSLLAEEMKSKGLLDVHSGVCEPCWIVDFPLFTKGENGELETCHHPFTAPHPSDVHLLETEPFRVRSLAYDLVMNGNEIGGGSVRAHNPDLQVKLLNMLNIDLSSMEHFIKALRSGCPPHAGIALGIDRMMALACNAESIRDVIAFPKSNEGKDPLSGAPNYISDEDKYYYHISIKGIVDEGKQSIGQ